MERIHSNHIWAVCWLHKAVSNTVTSFALNVEVIRKLAKDCPNISLARCWDIPKAAQWCFNSWRQEIDNLIIAFWEEKWVSIAQELHQRKKLEGKDCDNFSVYLNINSIEFYRDTNISLSFFDEQNQKEVAILWFFINDNKSVEIFQLQWRRKFWITKEHFWELIGILREFLWGLWFEKIYIVKSSKNYLTQKPPFIPSRVQTQEQYEDRLKRHQHMMKLTYDVNPTRKWWFGKVSTEEEKKYYSGVLSLEDYTVTNGE